MGVGTLAELDTDNFDNGLFVVDFEWNIKKRHFNTSDDSTLRVPQLSKQQKEQYNSMRACILERHILICEHDKAA